MEKKVNSYRLFCEAKLRDVLIDNLQPKKQQQYKYKKALADAGIEDMAHIVNQPWFWLGSWVTELLAAHLRIDPTWNYLERWLDNSEFSSITVTNANTITVTGSLWWGYRENIGGAQTPEAIEAEFVLAEEQLSYSIKLYADGLCRHITNAGITRTLIEAPATSETDLTALLASLKNKGENAPPKSPIIHMGFGPVLHNINYLTAYTIAQSGNCGLEALLELLKEQDIELQNAAIYALGLIGEKAHLAIPVILAVLPDANQQFRCLAVVALCRIISDWEENLALLRSFVPDLLKALNKQNFEDEDLYSDTSNTARIALTELARCDQSLMPLLIQAFEKGEAPLTLSRIFYDLGSTAREAIPVLTKAMNDANGENRAAAARVLSHMGIEGIQIITQKLKDEDKRVRYAAVFGIEESTKEGLDDLKTVIPALLQALQENWDDARLFCAIALSLARIDLQDRRIIETLNSIIPNLILVIQQLESFTAGMAIETVELIGAPAAEVVPVLIAGLRDEEKDDVWRKAALKALHNLCLDIDILRPLFIDLIKERGWLAEDAIDMLVASDSPEALADVLFTLSDILKDKDSEGFGHYNAFEALQKIGAASIPLLVDLSQGDVPYLRHSAVRTLGHFGKQAVPYLIQALANSDSDTRSTAAQALGEIGADASVAIASLEHALSDSELDVCARAVEALGRIDKQSVPALIRALKGEDSFAAMWAAAVLGRMGGDAHEATPALVEALHHNDAQVRELAAYALHQQAESSMP
jgi:HEAT repeat protein